MSIRSHDGTQAEADSEIRQAKKILQKWKGSKIHEMYELRVAAELLPEEPTSRHQTGSKDQNEMKHVGGESQKGTTVT